MDRVGGPRDMSEALKWNVEVLELKDSRIDCRFRVQVLKRSRSCQFRLGFRVQVKI